MRLETLVRMLKRPVLTPGPDVWTDGGRLYAGTPRIHRCLTLFFYARRVIADRPKKQIEICVTTFWFSTSKTQIPFSDIEAIDISEREMINDQGWSLDNLEKTGFGGSDPTRIYSVQARIKSSPCPVDLFSFVDEGTVNLGGLGMFLDDEGIDPPGPQKKKADRYAGLLSDFIGVPLWRDHPVQFTFDANNTRECAKCGHRISLRAIRCAYCGSEVSTSGDG